MCAEVLSWGGLLLTLGLGAGPTLLWGEGLVPAPYPVACRCPSEATDSCQVQGNEERVPQHPAVHHCLRLHQPLHQILVLDSPCQSLVPALRTALGPQGVHVCPPVHVLLARPPPVVVGGLCSTCLAILGDTNSTATSAAVVHTWTSHPTSCLDSMAVSVSTCTRGTRGSWD